MTFLRFPRLASLAALVLISGLAACGGGTSDAPAAYPSQTVSGTVVIDGAARSNALVHITCANGGGDVRNYYATTDTQGTYRKSVDAALAPCVADAFAGTTYLFGFVAAFDKSEVTANISPLTDTMLIAMLGTSTFADTLPSADGLASLKTKIAQNKHVSAWTQLRQQLLNGTDFTDPVDVAAMSGDPATDVLQIAANVTRPGHFALLQKLYNSGINSRAQRQVLISGQRFELVSTSQGAEVADLLTGLVWQRCVLGMVWNGTNCTGTAGTYYWTEVAGLVAASSPSQAPNALAWRMPSSYELNTLRALNAQGIDPHWFPASPGYWTWTGESPCWIGAVSYPALVVHMQDFTSGCGENSDQLYVRLVR